MTENKNRCPKCGAPVKDQRVTLRGNGWARDASGAYVRTECVNGHFVGYRPAQPNR